MCPFSRINHLGGVRRRVNCGQLVEFFRLSADSEGYPLVPSDVRKLLARTEDEEVECQAVVDVTDDRRLRPSVGPQCGDGHGPMSAENLDLALLHGDLRFPTCT